MAELLTAAGKLSFPPLEELDDRMKRRNGLGNREEILKAIVGTMTPEEADRIQKRIDDAFERIDE